MEANGVTWRRSLPGLGRKSSYKGGGKGGGLLPINFHSRRSN